MDSKDKNTVNVTKFEFKDQDFYYKGKVRDVYKIKDKMVMVASDRISAFDHILPRAIPYKGQVLNQIAAYFLQATKDIVPNWLIATPDPNVSVGHACEPIRLEMVIRGYLAGHAWREYKAGERVLCGQALPQDMKENDAFLTPIVTPASKAEEGHDEDISVAEILSQGIVTREQWDLLEKYTKKLFYRGQKMANERGLILVDTKYEFGIYNGEIILIDEIHTPDSSRYFYLEGYEDRQAKGEPQKQLSKEFVREWLMEQGFQGKEGQTMPIMPDEFINLITERYIELYEKITGQSFIKSSSDDIQNRIYNNIIGYLEKH